MPRISHIVIEDHRRLKEQFRAADSATTAEEKSQWRDNISLEIARHCVCEDLLLRNAIKTHVTQGEDLWTSFARDHTSMKDKLHKLSVIPPDDANFQPVLESLRLDLVGHVSDVNVHVFAQLEGALSPTESEALATEYCEKRNARAAELAEGDKQSTAALVREFLESPSDRLEDLDHVLSANN